MEVLLALYILGPRTLLTQQKLGSPILLPLLEIRIRL